jgi:hypothetical protein
MQAGGNHNAHTFFKTHGQTTNVRQIMLPLRCSCCVVLERCGMVAMRAMLTGVGCDHQVCLARGSDVPPEAGPAR